MFKALIGDLFATQAQALVNTVNCVGVMGKGVALDFKNRFPAMFEDYAARCSRKDVQLGTPYLFRDPSGLAIINFPTKQHWRAVTRLHDIERGLDHVIAHLGEWGITSLALPPLGCGNGGLQWSEVGPLIYRKLAGLPLDVESYAPYGTPAAQLSADYLGSPFQLSLDGKGHRHEKINPEWVVLMEVLRELSVQAHAPAIGRMLFQYLCYLLTELGVATGFQFGKGGYQPLPAQVQHVLTEFANRNWLTERRHGSLIALQVSPAYERDRRRFRDVLTGHQRTIDKTVDLFSRIQTADQGEVVVSVLYASRQLRMARPGVEIEEQALCDWVLDWRTQWQSPEGRRRVGSAVRNLAVLGWLRVRLAPPLEDAA